MNTTKQVLVVRKDLNMRTGKIAAQCTHAVKMIMLNTPYPCIISMGEYGRQRGIIYPPHMETWLDKEPFTTICVYVKSEEELRAIYCKAIEARILASLVIDSGKTEFHGVPTPTVVGVGPDLCENIDTITGHLPLL